MGVTPTGSIAASGYSFTPLNFGGVVGGSIASNPSGYTGTNIGAGGVVGGSIATSSPYSGTNVGAGGVTGQGTIFNSKPYAGTNVGPGGVTGQGTIFNSKPYAGTNVGPGGVTGQGTIASSYPYLGTGGASNIGTPTYGAFTINNLLSNAQAYLPQTTPQAAPSTITNTGSIASHGITGYPANNNTMTSGHYLNNMAGSILNYIPGGGYGSGASYFGPQNQTPIGNNFPGYSGGGTTNPYQPPTGTTQDIPGAIASNNTMTSGHYLNNMAGSILNYIPGGGYGSGASYFGPQNQTPVGNNFPGYSLGSNLPNYSNTNITLNNQPMPASTSYGYGTGATYLPGMYNSLNKYLGNKTYS